MIIFKRKNKFHLTNILSLGSDSGDLASPTSPVATKITEPRTALTALTVLTAQTEENEKPLKEGFRKFKVNWQACQKPVVSPRKVSSPIFSVRTESSEDIMHAQKYKPQAAFLATSREKLGELRIKVKWLIATCSHY